MLAQIMDLWTVDRIVLTAVVVSGCAVLALLTPRPFTPPAGRRRNRINLESSRSGSGGRRHVNGASRISGAALTVALIVVAGLLLERSSDPIGLRSDSWSEGNVLVSGRNYARQGLFACYGVAQHQVVTDRNPPDPFYLYNRYPVGPNLLNGAWQINGIESIPVQRLLPTACSLASVVLWYGLLRRLAGQGVALLAALSMLFSYGFLAYADHLHFHAYSMLTSVAALRCYLCAARDDGRRRLLWFIPAALLMFVTAWLTWEYNLWMLIFIGLHAALFGCSFRRVWLVLLVAPLLAALALQTVQRRAAFADVQTAPSHAGHGDGGFLTDVYRRTLGFDVADDTPRGLTLSKYPSFLLYRYFEFYGLPAEAALAVLAMILVRSRRPVFRDHGPAGGAKLAVLLFVAGGGWWMVMMQHTAVHPHVMRHGLAGYVVLLALAWIHCWKTARSPAFPSLARAAAVVLALALGSSLLTGLVRNLRLHYGIDQDQSRDLRPGVVLESRQMSPLARIVPEGAVILTNHNRLPVMRFWSERPVYDGGTWTYPVHDSPDARMMVEMSFNHLRQLYGDKLPSLYYVYGVWAPSFNEAFDADPLMRLFLTGREEDAQDSWPQAQRNLVDVWQTGRCDQSFCPIVARIDNLLVFNIDPAVDLMRRKWSHLGFPSLQDFGPAR